MHTINIKPLSVNECWTGRRFKTDKYKKYERDVLLILPKITIPLPPYALIIEVGYSSASSDLDNSCKPFIDILQKKYGINDKHIKILTMIRHTVKKGQEFIKFNLESLKL